MNAETFLSSFDHIVSGPGGIGSLRELIYHLAFAGKLVDHSETDASGLVEALLKKRSPTGRVRHYTEQSSAGYYSIPPHWRWINIGLIGHDWGQEIPTSDFTYIDISAVDNQRGIISGDARILTAAKAPSRARKIVKKGTVIYSTVRPYLLNIAIIERDFDPAPIASTAFAILHPYQGVEAKFVYYFLRSPAFVAYVESVQSGIAYPAISDEKFFAASFPLPPTEEQKRIVAKVDELMALCEDLEAHQQERARRFPVVSKACHTNFTESPSVHALNRIFDETDAVSPDDLRKTIMTIAVQGKLLGRIASEGTGADILKGPGIIDAPPDELPKLPDHWRWARLGNITTQMDSGWSPACHPEPANDGEWGVLRTTAVQMLNYREAENKALPSKLEPRPEHEVMDGDILFTRAGPMNRVGIVCVAHPTRKKLMISDKIIRFHLLAGIDSDFAALSLNAGHSSETIERLKSGMAASQVNVSQPKLRTVPIPIPPHGEQLRIVAKVGELMALVEQLEAQHRERDKLAEAFAKACIASFTGTRFEKTEKMKAPKTELISIVRLGKMPGSDTEAPLAALLENHKGELPAKALWQQSGLTIDAFYQQLKTEIIQGWIAPPREAKMKISEEA
jgi:type I restriction enzyme S subunit